MKPSALNKEGLARRVRHSQESRPTTFAMKMSEAGLQIITMAQTGPLARVVRPYGRTAFDKPGAAHVGRAPWRAGRCWLLSNGTLSVSNCFSATHGQFRKNTVKLRLTKLFKIGITWISLQCSTASKISIAT